MTINTGGEKVFAEEVEQALKHHRRLSTPSSSGGPASGGARRWWRSSNSGRAAADRGRAAAEAARHVARYKLPKGFVLRRPRRAPPHRQARLRLGAGSRAGAGEDVFAEPARDVPVIGRPDVLVVGGGSAGIAAAIASARRGADTWLIESTGIVGGLATVGLINLLLTLDDGAGHPGRGRAVPGGRRPARPRATPCYPPRRDWNSEDPAEVARWRRWGLIWGAPRSRCATRWRSTPSRSSTSRYDLLRAAGVRLRLHTWFARGRRWTAAASTRCSSSRSGAARRSSPRVVIDAPATATCSSRPARRSSR